MSDKFCCVTWETLHQELAHNKRVEIDALIEEKGLPASMFAPILKVLDRMGNHCPVCKPEGVLPVVGVVPPKPGLSPEVGAFSNRLISPRTV